MPLLSSYDSDVYTILWATTEAEVIDEYAVTAYTALHTCTVVWGKTPQVDPAGVSLPPSFKTLLALETQDMSGSSLDESTFTSHHQFLESPAFISTRGGTWDYFTGMYPPGKTPISLVGNVVVPLIDFSGKNPTSHNQEVEERVTPEKFSSNTI